MSNVNQSERYEVEVVTPDGEVYERRTSYSDLDSAMADFYCKIGENYDEPSYNIAVHDLVAGKTRAAWWYEPNEEIGKAHYDTPTSVLGN